MINQLKSRLTLVVPVTGMNVSTSRRVQSLENVALQRAMVLTGFTHQYWAVTIDQSMEYTENSLFLPGKTSRSKALLVVVHHRCVLSYVCQATKKYHIGRFSEVRERASLATLVVL